MSNYFRVCFLFLFLMLVSCAKRGSITGGLKDTIAPVLLESFPKNYSTNFKGKEIKLVFNEYVKLKNINKQLVVSPFMKNEPLISPNNASKVITIKIKDTLKENATYSFNFGQSIEDNNEGIPLSQFKYVFSTGNVIDSLKVKVTVKDALENKVPSFVTVMLYEVDEKFTDSTIYKKPPAYVANTLDSLKTVTLENIKQGKYRLIALKDNGNNVFNPKVDKIGFQKDDIDLPETQLTLYELELFKEALAFNTMNQFQVAGNRIVCGYEGNVKGIKATLKNGNTILPSVVNQVKGKDSLQIWYKPIKVDSLQLELSKDKYNKILSVKTKEMPADSLSFSIDYNGNLPLRERFSIQSATPLVNFDASKIIIINKDSIAVPFTKEYDAWNQKLYLDFEKQPLERYKIQLLPGAITDFFDKANDTLIYRLSTKNLSDYGNLKVVLENAKSFPVLVELTDKDGKVKASAYSVDNPVVEFLALEPNLYTLRIIYDENSNGVWDTGSYLEKRQTEEVLYFPKPLDVRANWDVEQPFDLSSSK
jgi:uncharacterized protein (DUF2141 family)